MNNPEVVLIDYGVGNIESVKRGFEYCGAKVRLSRIPEEITSADRVVLPGVGAFQDGMNSLRSLGLIEAIAELKHRNIPLLGICLGMQLLLDQSEEFGVTAGLGLIPGRVVPVPSKTTDGQKNKIPNVGWREVMPLNGQDQWIGTTLENNQVGESFYFVHSFMVKPKDSEVNIAECMYGGHKISAVISRNRITGCQFHPEKSGRSGLKLLNTFMNQ